MSMARKGVAGVELPNVSSPIYIEGKIFFEMFLNKRLRYF